MTAGLLTAGQMLAAHARLMPDAPGAGDLGRTMSFAARNARARRLANALLGLGLAKVDQIAVLVYNRLEWAEIYVATAKAGLASMAGIEFALRRRDRGGFVMILHPEEQFDHLGTVGRGVAGSAAIRLLDDSGNEVPDGMPGELFSHSPYQFDSYCNLPEATAESLRGGRLSVGGVALRNGHGFSRLIDRNKKNLIISVRPEGAYH